MHLSNSPIPRPMERRSTAININYLAREADFDQKLKEIRTLPVTLQLLQCQKTIDLTHCNGSSNNDRHIQMQQQEQHQLTQKFMHDATYCFERLSNV